jgi:hypothetical protein
VSETPRNLTERLKGLEGCTVAVCTAGDCSGPAESIIAALRPIIATCRGAVLLRSECVRACRHAPVVIIERRASPNSISFTVALTIADRALLAGLGRWVAAGGPGTVPLSDELHSVVFAAH